MKNILAGLAFLLALSAGARAQIAPLTGPSDPSQLIGTLNQVIRAINAQSYALAFPTPVAGASSSPNSLLLTSVGSGAVPTIALGTTADANASIGISPNGSGNLVLFGSYGGANETGVVQYANAASWVPRLGIASCPGFQRQGVLAPAGMRDHIAGYLVFQDWLGRSHYVPSC